MFEEQDDVSHLRATMAWLADAQDACDGDGVSNAYHLNGGWGVAYPETSGYILATYLTFADFSGEHTFMDRALRIGDWEIRVQAPNGGVFSSTALRQTRVFNTGQVILGWCALYERTKLEKYLEAAERAGDYLLGIQEADGAWRRDTYCGARTYHARVDWALLRLARLSGEARYGEAAARNLRWVLGNQLSNGWFAQCGFGNDPPITHVIAYTLRGLLECASTDKTLDNSLGIFSATMKCTDALCRALQAQPVAGIHGMVPASFDQAWKSPARDSCLTGNSQLASFLFRICDCTRDSTYGELGAEILSATKRTQIVDTSLRPLRGAIAGSFPFCHGYSPNVFPNWAAKFFADALLMKINSPKGIAIPA
ncbi:MAG: hypothetical protein WC728_11990 [Elusimicrobiota bacterium]